MEETNARCGVCGRDAAEPSVPSFRCPGCDREIPDVTNVLARLPVTEEDYSCFSENVMRAEHVVPFACYGDTLRWASDFTVRVLSEELRFVFNQPIYLVYAETRAIFDAIDRRFGRS